MEKHRNINAPYKYFRKDRTASALSEQMMDTLLEHCKKVYNPPNIRRGVEVGTGVDIGQIEDELTHPTTISEIIEALKTCHSRSKCIDGYSQMDLKLLKEDIAPVLQSIFNSSLNTGIFPTRFLKNTNVFLYKGGDAKDPAQYRSIVVQNPVLKVFCKILQTRLAPRLEKILPPTQFGFRKNRNTVSAAFTLKEIIKRRMEAKKKTMVLYIDFRKAFPSVKRNLLFKTMKENGISEKFINIIQNIYMETKIFIRYDKGFLSEYYQTTIGLPEGCCLSPILFALFIEDLDRFGIGKGVLLEDGHGNNRKIWYLAYADDLAMVCDDKEDLNETIIAVERFCLEKELNINVKKTKIMSFGRGRPVKMPEFMMSNEKVEVVNSFRYLGLKFTVGLSFSEHLNESCSKALSRSAFLFNKLPLGEFGLDMIRKIFRVYIEPIFSYGLAVVWGAVSKNSKMKMDAVWTQFLKRWLGIPVGSNNAYLYHYTNTIALSSWFDEVLFDKCWFNTQLPHLRGFIFDKPNFQGLTCPNIQLDKYSAGTMLEGV